MKKWIGPILAFVLLVLMISFSGSLNNATQERHQIERERKPWMVPAQSAEEETKYEPDSTYVQILKHLKDQVDNWLKSLNDRIENEDITHFEVRFLEVLRNLLEWAKGKIDAELESPSKKKRKGLTKETDL